MSRQSKPHEVVIVICDENEGRIFKSLGWFETFAQAKIVVGQTVSKAKALPLLKSGLGRCRSPLRRTA
jgi:hypothetical protein